MCGRVLTESIGAMMVLRLLTEYDDYMYLAVKTNTTKAKRYGKQGVEDPRGRGRQGAAT